MAKTSPSNVEKHVKIAPASEQAERPDGNEQIPPQDPNVELTVTQESETHDGERSSALSLHWWHDKVLGEDDGHAHIFPDVEEMKRKVRQALLKPTYNVFDFYWETGCFQAIARSHYFENITLSVIGINALWIAVDTDVNDAETLVEAHIIFQIMENFFCTYFTFEWIVRFGAFRSKINCLRDGWFVFDSLMVTMMIGETWVLTAVVLLGSGANIPFGNTGVLRLFRLLRLSRMARMLRSMPELMILIKGMTAAARSVTIVTILQMLVLFVFGILFTQLADGTVMGAYYFPSVQKSMYTLLIYGTFLDDLGPFSNEVGAESAACLALVFVFVMVSACTVLNMLIGVLCEVVTAVAATEKEEMLVTFVTSKLQNLLSRLDKNSDGHISKAEFHNILGMPEAAIALAEVGVDPVTIVDFTEYLFDNEEDAGPLPFDKFMEHILNLRSTNEATIRDMVDLRKILKAEISNAEEQIFQSLDKAIPKDLPGSMPGQASMADMKARATKLERLMESTLKEVRNLGERISQTSRTTHEKTVAHTASLEALKETERLRLAAEQRASEAEAALRESQKGTAVAAAAPKTVSSLPRAQVLPRSIPCSPARPRPSSEPSGRRRAKLRKHSDEDLRRAVEPEPDELS
eukprot:TRINITY_DN21983_c0_g1_i1.p1 TRINITY_DN21983_c0_g1~~TRINITY_DN21983_c0_g1_i1.p1  ORF type:complete len:635 (-),score=154.87 TRINITY_DN21983_c0_g1_i1:18-1922(-)